MATVANSIDRGSRYPYDASDAWWVSLGEAPPPADRAHRGTQQQLGGGVYATYDYNDFPAFIHEFDEPLSNADFKTIINSNNGLMEFKMYEDQIRKGWFDLVKFIPATGKATFQLSSNKKLN
jgi:hypothetical protein